MNRLSATQDSKVQDIKTEETIHKGERRIKLVFNYDSWLIGLIRKVPGCRWSQTMKCWHIPDNEESINAMLKIITESDAQAWFKQAPAIKRTEPERFGKADKVPGELHARHTENFIRWLKGQRYSAKTIQAYKDALLVFLRFYRDRSIETIDNNDIIRFNYEYIIKNKYSGSYQNQVINAVKLFFRITENKVITEDEIERPRRPKKLPDILAQSEIEDIIKKTINLKHRAMLSLIYACGLRRSELLNLELNSVDSKRNLLIIKDAKGSKDRLVPLPVSIIEMLRVYYKCYRPRHWLFEGGKAAEKYTESSIQQVFRQAVKRAGIKKNITLHTLRHCYATHLLENGTDLRFIQELLGHKSSKTTEIYTHVSAKSIERIKSPFENLKL